MNLAFLDKLEAVRPFSEREAWGLFRIAALGEAFGWAVLISGILIRHYQLPGHNIAVPIAGQVHGTLFVIYFLILISVYSSLRWPRRRFVVAAAAGVIPFGTLAFEQWAAHKRRHTSLRTLLVVLALRQAT